MGLAMLGLPSGGPSPTPDTVDIFSDPVIYGVGASSSARTTLVRCGRPSSRWSRCKPSKAIAFIGNTYGTIDLKGDVLYDRLTGGFGTATTTLPNSPNPSQI